MGVKVMKLMQVDVVLVVVCCVKVVGVQWFCMGVVWCSLKDCDFDVICIMVKGVCDLGLEICMMLGMLMFLQVVWLKEVGFDFYNYNIDILFVYYLKIVMICMMEDWLDMLDYVWQGGIKVCCGGIFGMGEVEEDRIVMLVVFVNFFYYFESVLINLWQFIGNMFVEVMV